MSNRTVRKVKRSRLIQNFERLEPRVFLCATPAEAMAAGVPQSMIMDDGHIRYSDFVTLSPQLQAHIDPHMVQAQSSEGPVDFDKLLGIPTHPELSNGGQTPATLADALPDFFPLMYQINTNLDLTSQPGRALMKFGTQVNNQGTGPGSLISGRPGIDPIPNGAPITSWVNADGSQNVLQTVWNFNGTSYTLSYYRAAGRFTYHEGHGHFHFDGYADYRLRYRLANGQPGDYVLRSDGTTVVGSKTGFCLLTFSGTFTTESGANSSTLAGFDKDTNVPSGCGLSQGVRVGRYDQYSSGLEGQWLDVAGVAPGQYFLEITLDGENAILETNEVNNAKNFAVTIPSYTLGSPIPPDNFDSGGQHNDTFATAADMHDMGVFTQTSLTLDWGLDYDYFKFTATSSGTYTLNTTGNGDVNMYLYDGAQNQIRSSTADGTATESVSYPFVKGDTYYVMLKSDNSTTSNNYQITWNIKPTVDWSSPARTVAEESSSYFTIARNGPTTSSIIVPLVIGGNAVAGQDYQALPSQITIDVGSSFINVPLIPIDNQVINSKRTVTVAAGSSSAYVIGTSASLTIIDQDAGRAAGNNAGFTLGQGSQPLALNKSVFSSSRILVDLNGNQEKQAAGDLL